MGHRDSRLKFPGLARAAAGEREMDRIFLATRADFRQLVFVPAHPPMNAKRIAPPATLGQALASRRFLAISISGCAVVATLAFVSHWWNGGDNGETGDFRKQGIPARPEVAQGSSDIKSSAERQAERERLIQQLLPPEVRAVYDLMVATEKGGYDPQEMWNVIEARKMPANIRSDLRVRVLAEVSRPDGCDAAVAFLNSRVGPGHDRTTLLVGAFASAVLDPASAIRALKKLEFPAEELERA